MTIDSYQLISWLRELGFNDKDVLHGESLYANDISKLLKSKRVNSALSYVVNNCKDEKEVKNRRMNTKSNLMSEIESTKQQMKSLNVELMALADESKSMESAISSQRMNRSRSDINDAITSSYLQKQTITREMISSYSSKINKYLSDMNSIHAREGNNDSGDLEASLNSVVRDTALQLLHSMVQFNSISKVTQKSQQFNFATNESEVRLFNALVRDINAVSGYLDEETKNFNLEKEAAQVELNVDGICIAKSPLEKVGAMIVERRNDHTDSFFQIMRMKNESNALNDNLQSLIKNNIAPMDIDLLNMYISGETEALNSVQSSLLSIKEQVLAKKKVSQELQSKSEKIIQFKAVAKEKHSRIGTLIRHNRKLLKSIGALQAHVRSYASQAIVNECHKFPSLSDSVKDILQLEYEKTEAVDLTNCRAVDGLLIREKHITERIFEIKEKELLKFLEIMDVESRDNSYSLLHNFQQCYSKLSTHANELDSATKVSNSRISHSRDIVEADKVSEKIQLQSCLLKLNSIKDSLISGDEECRKALISVDDWKELPAQYLCDWKHLHGYPFKAWLAEVKTLNTKV